VHHTYANKDLIKYAATLPNYPHRCILIDYFNKSNLFRYPVCVHPLYVLWPLFLVLFYFLYYNYNINQKDEDTKDDRGRDGGTNFILRIQGTGIKPNPSWTWWWTKVTLARSNSALHDDGDYTETCWSCFNVNFNVNFEIVFKTIQLFISWWIKLW